MRNPLEHIKLKNHIEINEVHYWLYIKNNPVNLKLTLCLKNASSYGDNVNIIKKYPKTTTGLKKLMTFLLMYL